MPDSWFTLATQFSVSVLSQGGLVQFFGPDTSSTATLGSDISLTHRAWRDQSDNGSQHAAADRPLDVLIVTSEAPPIISGISTCVARLAGGLTARAAPRPGDLIRADQASHVRRMAVFLLRGPLAADSSGNCGNFDVVNVHGPVPTISDVFLGLSNLLPDHSRPAIVYTYHSPIDIPAAARLARMYDKFHVQLALRADRIIASSQHYARQHHSRYGPMVQAIPWGTDPGVAASLTDRGDAMSCGCCSSGRCGLTRACRCCSPPPPNSPG